MNNHKTNNDFNIPYKPIAYCLYRVSTAGQVDKVKNDIPMQKEECREFAARQGWIVGRSSLKREYPDLRCPPRSEMLFRT